MKRQLLKFKFKYTSREEALENIGDANKKVVEKFGHAKLTGQRMSAIPEEPSAIRIGLNAKRQFSDVEVRKGLRKLFPLKKVRTKGSDFTIDF